mmetsp:Transcript_5752/g.22700  ORF Transcript_5752/g.22700 Transcript_5752/m.22700 type:complete len:372 (+) Transcript_5752:6341-7456(+)
MIGELCAKPFDKVCLLTPGGRTALINAEPSLSPTTLEASSRAAAAEDAASLPAATAILPSRLALLSQCADRRGSKVYFAPGKYIVASNGCVSHARRRIFKCASHSIGRSFCRSRTTEAHFFDDVVDPSGTNPCAGSVKSSESTLVAIAATRPDVDSSSSLCPAMVASCSRVTSPNKAARSRAGIPLSLAITSSFMTSNILNCISASSPAAKRATFPNNTRCASTGRSNARSFVEKNASTNSQNALRVDPARTSLGSFLRFDETPPSRTSRGGDAILGNAASEKSNVRNNSAAFRFPLPTIAASKIKAAFTRTRTPLPKCPYTCRILLVMIARARESNANRSLVDVPSPASSLPRVIIVPHIASRGAHTFCA